MINAISLFRQGHYQKSLECFENCLLLNPFDANIHKSIIEISMHVSYPTLLSSIDRALRLFPDCCDFWNYKGLYLKKALLLEESKECFLRALKVCCNDLERSSIWLNLGSLYSCQGSVLIFIKSCARAIKLYPDRKETYITLAFMSNYFKDVNETAKLIGIDAQSHDDFLTKIYSKMYGGFIYRELGVFEVESDRIGYVTADLVGSACSRFMDAILNHSSMKVFVYSNTPVEQSLLGDKKYYYRDISSLEDSDVISLIKKDKIGHLVDLSGLTRGNRNSLFWKLQTQKKIKLYSYLGYPSNVCVPGMKRISDECTEATEFNQSVITMPGFFLCYKNPLVPSNEYEYKNELLTFGSFAKLEKINDEVIALWKRLLIVCETRGTQAQFVIKSRYFEDPKTRNIWFDKLGNKSFKLISGALDDPSHMQRYRMMDVQLDTFPYSGTTVSCDSLYMGVPVVTLKGSRHIERVTASLLTAMGLESEMVANNEEEYIEKAIHVALNRSSFKVHGKFMSVMCPDKFMNKYEHISPTFGMSDKSHTFEKV